MILQTGGFAFSLTKTKSSSLWDAISNAFNGAFAYALSNNHKNKDALEFANKVAGISTTRAGAANAMPGLEEVENY